MIILITYFNLNWVFGRNCALFVCFKGGMGTGLALVSPFA